MPSNCYNIAMIRRVATFLFGLSLALSFLGSTANATGNLNNFTVSDYGINYNLSRDKDNRSVLTTKESITADFPASDQNHGIERYIPTKYKSHTTNLQINAVTDESGAKRHYTTYSSGDYQVVRIGDANNYLHGQQKFVITYTQHDVTNYFDNTKSDEFYWDTNGTAWQVPITHLTVSMTLDKSLVDTLSGNTACYEGAFGDTGTCKLSKVDNNFHTTASDLSPGQNVSIAIGFKPGTFAAYKMSTSTKLLILYVSLQVLLFIGSLAIIIWLTIIYSRRSSRKSELHTIIPEYIPPVGTSVTVSAKVLGSSKAFAAQLIDLAVRHYIRLYQTKQKSGLFSRDEYAIEILRSIDDLLPEEQEIINDVFDGKTTIGSRVELADLEKNRVNFAARLADNSSKLQKLIDDRYKLYGKPPEQSALFSKTAKYLFILTVVFLSPVLLITALLAYVLSKTLKPLTDKGLELTRYLEGLKLYIGVAETERLRMLQSPEGAEKVGIIGEDKGQLVKLYERVLPYAILFNQEKQWNTQLSHYYADTNVKPDWYSGVNGLTAFNIAGLATAINRTSIIATGSSSSSSGGSGGGGFSGGGGGGGGGGGW